MGIGLSSSTPSTQQEAAKAARAVMTAAAVMMASKQANRNKELLEKSVLPSACRKPFKSFQNGKARLVFTSVV